MGRATGHIYGGNVQEARLHPKLHNITWAAGYFEGEGNITNNKGSCYISISQNQSWPNEGMLALFGGSLRFRQVDAKRNPHISSFWFCTGPRARGLAMTLYPFLSPNRKMQVRKALGR